MHLVELTLCSGDLIVEFRKLGLDAIDVGGLNGGGLLGIDRNWHNIWLHGSLDLFVSWLRGHGSLVLLVSWLHVSLALLLVLGSLVLLVSWLHGSLVLFFSWLRGLILVLFFSWLRGLILVLLIGNRRAC